MNKKIRTDAVDHLFDAILCLQNKEDCYSFFEDLCTVNELLSLSQRFEVASMLRDHKTYLEIAEKTGASTATISRVNRSLNYGDDGYELVFERMQWLVYEFDGIKVYPSLYSIFCRMHKTFKKTEKICFTFVQNANFPSLFSCYASSAKNKSLTLNLYTHQTLEQVFAFLD